MIRYIVTAVDYENDHNPLEWEPTSTKAPDGTYDMWFDEYVTRNIIVVKDGEFVDTKTLIIEALKLRERVGYCGAFLESLNFNKERFSMYLES